MPQLNLPACPICHAKDSLSRETMERAGQPLTWYECRECGSVLLWMGDDRWAYQKVGREEKAYLLKQPMTSDELTSLLPLVGERPTGATGTEEPSDTDLAVSSEVQVPSGGRRAKPSRLLLVGLVVTIVGFVVGVFLLLVLLSPDGKSTPQQASEPEGTAIPAFAAGDKVRLANAAGGTVAMWEMESGCQLVNVGYQAKSGRLATVGEGLCYNANKREWYHHVRCWSGDCEGWVRTGEMVPFGEYTPPPQPTRRPTPAQGLSTPRSSGATRGWLCDYDGTGRIRLWTAASMKATVKDVVETCVSCCVDVMMYERDLANGIYFYRISVGPQSGWVDLDYYYRDKPAWSRN
jgi:hypothetical protein